ncbi:MAG TPA: LysR family transcriptional regulator [Roseomonas sp.]|jgi:DNA-binding transcriptional LysR family regulator
MTSRELEIFHAVMSSRSLTEAAISLGISQPALSKALKRLEDRLHMQLFRRVKGRLRPTLEAESLFPESARLIREIARLGRTAAELRGGESGLLRVAASASLGMSVIPRIVAEFARAFPKVKIVSHVVPAATCAELVVGNHVDVGFCLSPISNPGSVSQTVASVPLACALHREDPLARKDVITPRDLSEARVISFGSNTYFGQLLDDAFACDGLERPLSIELITSIQAPALVQSGAGIAIVDRYMEGATLAGIVWRPLLPLVMLPVNVITSTMRPTSRLTSRFVESFIAAVGAGDVKPPHAPARRGTGTNSRAPA